MAWTLCTSGSAIRKAGANANSTIVASGSALSDWSDEAEAYVCDITRVDVVTNFGSLTSNGKQILQTLCSSLIAQRIIGYDMSGYFSRQAETMLDILENEIDRCERLVKDEKVKTYLEAT